MQVSEDFNPADLKVLFNHIYEYKKGVRRMVLYTVNRKYLDFAGERLAHQGISYYVLSAGKNNVNLFFGRDECIDTVRCLIRCPLNQLTPEQDFILGTLLGYDVCVQCERYCGKVEAIGKMRLAVS